MMFLPRLYARLCARQAGRTLLANRITQNYSQFMRCPEADVPADFLHQNAHELSGFNFVEQIFPPALWARNVRFDLHAYVAQWTQEQAFYSSSRTLLLGDGAADGRTPAGCAAVLHPGRGSKGVVNGCLNAVFIALWLQRPNAAADLFAARGRVWAGESGVCARGLPSGRRRHAERAA